MVLFTLDTSKKAEGVANDEGQRQPDVQGVSSSVFWV